MEFQLEAGQVLATMMLIGLFLLALIGNLVPGKTSNSQNSDADFILSMSAPEFERKYGAHQ